MSGRADLAAQQRGLLALLKGRPVASGEDRYLDLIRESRGLAMLQTITTWWRRFDLERLAPLTSGALTHQGRFEEALTRLGRDADTPVAISALVLHFLGQYAEDTDPLIAAVARTERALILVARGDSSHLEVSWDREPAPVLNALAAGGRPGPVASGGFRVTVSRDRPALITVTRQSR